MGALRYTVMYVIVGIYLASLWLGGWWLLAVPLVTFGLIPSLDELLAKDNGEPEREAWLHDLVVRLYAPAHFALGATLWVAPASSSLELGLTALALGVLCGAGGINVAHELMHRPSKTDKAIAELLMLSSSYPWFCVEHVLGHHRHVGTPKDPATARRGQTVYDFVPRSLVGGFLSFLEIEEAYAGRRGIRWWSVRDRRTRYALSLAALYGGLGWLGGPLFVGLFFAQSLVSILLLEIINYVEHYGLARKEIRPGEYERVQPEHSWNSNHAVTAAFLFNLPRHADHHAYASRPYHMLRAWPDAPELPLGYSAMLLVALVPPLWFHLMDSRVDAIAARGALTSAARAPS